MSDKLMELTEKVSNIIHNEGYHLAIIVMDPEGEIVSQLL